MKPRSLLYSFEQKVSINLSHHHIDEALTQINFFHTGKNTLAVDQVVSEELRDAAFAIRRPTIVTVILDLYSDGSRECRLKPKNSF
jgi:hypothetical protein